MFKMMFCSVITAALLGTPGAYTDLTTKVAQITDQKPLTLGTPDASSYARQSAVFQDYVR